MHPTDRTATRRRRLIPRALGALALAAGGAGAFVACSEVSRGPTAPRAGPTVLDVAGSPTPGAAAARAPVPRPDTARLTLGEHHALTATVRARVERLDAEGRVVATEEQPVVEVEGPMRGGAVIARSADARLTMGARRRSGVGVHLAQRRGVAPAMPRFEMQRDDEGHLITTSVQPGADGSPMARVSIERDGVPVIVTEQAWRSVAAGWVLDSTVMTLHADGRAVARYVVRVEGAIAERSVLADQHGDALRPRARAKPATSRGALALLEAALLPTMAHAALPARESTPPVATVGDAAAAPLGCFVRASILLAEALAIGISCVGTAGIGCLAGIPALALTYLDWHDNCAQ